MSFKVITQILHLEKQYNFIFNITSSYFDTWKLIHDNIYKFLNDNEINCKHLVITNYNVFNNSIINISCHVV